MTVEEATEQANLASGAVSAAMAAAETDDDAPYLPDSRPVVHTVRSDSARSAFSHSDAARCERAYPQATSVLSNSSRSESTRPNSSPAHSSHTNSTRPNSTRPDISLSNGPHNRAGDSQSEAAGHARHSIRADSDRLDSSRPNSGSRPDSGRAGGRASSALPQSPAANTSSPGSSAADSPGKRRAGAAARLPAIARLAAGREVSDILSSSSHSDEGSIRGGSAMVAAHLTSPTRDDLVTPTSHISAHCPQHVLCRTGKGIFMCVQEVPAVLNGMLLRNDNRLTT